MTHVHTWQSINYFLQALLVYQKIPIYNVVDHDIKHITPLSARRYPLVSLVFEFTA